MTPPCRAAARRLGRLQRRRGSCRSRDTGHPPRPRRPRRAARLGPRVPRTRRHAHRARLGNDASTNVGVGRPCASLHRRERVGQAQWGLTWVGGTATCGRERATTTPPRFIDQARWAGRARAPVSSAA
jgi:hypothetical protein